MYEHKVYHISSYSADTLALNLDRLSKEGWEVVTVISTYYIILRRKIKE